MGIIRTIYNRTVNIDKPARVLCFPYNGHFDLSLLETGHDFYFVRNVSVNKWPAFHKHDSLHFHVIEESQVHEGFDVILFNDRQVQKPLIDRYAYELHAPSIIVDHKPLSMNPYLIKSLYKSQPFTSIQCYQNDSDIPKILYALNPTEYNNSKNKDIDVLFTNTPRPDKVSVVQQILSKYPIMFVGNKIKEVPQLEPEQTETYEDYKKLFARAKVFIHLPSHAGISHELILALNHGCWVLGLSDIITDADIMKHPRYISATLDLTGHIKQLLSKSPPPADLLYTSNYNQYIKSWTDLIAEHQKKVYHHENSN